MEQKHMHLNATNTGECTTEGMGEEGNISLFPDFRTSPSPQQDETCMVFENYFIISLILTVTPGSLETSGNTSL